MSARPKTIEGVDLASMFAAFRTGLAEALGETAEDLAEQGAPDISAAPLVVLARNFALDAFELSALVFAAMPALDPQGRALIARMQEGRSGLPSIGLALSLLPGANWAAFSAEGRLRANALIELGEGQAVTARPLIVPERVMHHLVGLDALDETLANLVARPHDDWPLAPSHVDLAARISGLLGEAGPNQPVVTIVGSDRAAAIAVADRAAREAGRRACLTPGDLLPTPPPERARVARLWSRETRLGPLLPLIDAHDLSAGPEQAALARFAASIAGPVVLLANEPAPFPLRASETFVLPDVGAAELTTLWRGELGPLAKVLGDDVSKVAAHFATPPALIGEIAGSARREAAAHAKRKLSREESRKALAAHLWRETRNRTRPRLDDLAQRIDSRSGWNELVLPTRQLDMLKVIAAQVRHRAHVHGAWGFGGASGRGLGVSALFAGPSGTGKTLAAEVIGGELGLDVYRIDLSNIVSKWLGETEKNLRRLFDQAERTSSILLFDESEALFSKRSEVRDSHDRYANTEISYLLQRMEAYRGLAILTTNLRSHLDPAFLRRLRFIVEFPFPGEAERRRIWELSLPDGAPRDGVDFGRLAQLNVTGGAIRNVALNAAFLAAESGRPISMSHLRAAVRAEYEKLGKPLTDSEFRGWAPEAVRG